VSQVTILQVVQSLRVGGLERVVVDLVSRASRDFRFVVCCLEEEGAWGNGFDPEHVKVVALHKPAGFNLPTAWKIAKLARTERARIVHTHNAAPHLYGALGGKLAGAKVIHTEHGKNVGDEARSFRINCFAARFTDLTVAVSEKVGRESRQHEGVPAKRLVVVPNGIPVEKFATATDRAAFRAELGLPAQAKLVGTVGRLVKEKNYRLLLQAFASAARECNDVYLIVAGDGPLREELESQARTLPVERVLFLGMRSDIPRLLGSLDVFALSSTTEGMSMALLEAMASGCAVVATAVGGNVEVIQNGMTGCIVPPGDANAFSAALVGLLKDAEQRRKLGSLAQQAVQQHYSLDKMVRRYEELWRQLAA